MSVYITEIHLKREREKRHIMAQKILIKHQQVLFLCFTHIEYFTWHRLLCHFHTELLPWLLASLRIIASTESSSKHDYLISQDSRFMAFLVVTSHLVFLSYPNKLSAQLKVFSFQLKQSSHFLCS